MTNEQLAVFISEMTEELLHIRCDMNDHSEEWRHVIFETDALLDKWQRYAKWLSGQELYSNDPLRS